MTEDIVADKPDSVFNETLKLVKKTKLPIFSSNCFINGNIKLIGPLSDQGAVLSYAETAFKRAHELGIKVVVLGSGNSRRIPDNMDFMHGKEQFVELCKILANIAKKYRIVIVLEPLNQNETNLVNTTIEGAEIVRVVNSRYFRLLADFYHMARSGESPYDNLMAVKDVLYHCHIAEFNRTFPGATGYDFSEYFRALKDMSYKGRISIECGMPDLDESLTNSINYIKHYYYAD